jgi:hypothetical protein
VRIKVKIRGFNGAGVTNFEIAKVVPQNKTAKNANI